MRIPTTSEVILWYNLIKWTILLCLVCCIFLVIYYFLLFLMAPGRYLLFLLTSNTFYCRFDHINLYVIIANLIIWFIICYIVIKCLKNIYIKKNGRRKKNK